jgi:hypothetical protein
MTKFSWMKKNDKKIEGGTRKNKGIKEIPLIYSEKEKPSLSL